MRFFENVQGIFLDDLDAIRVLHNSRHMVMYERALGEFWRHLGWKKLLDFESDPDALQVVRENRVEYLRPVAGVDEVRIRTHVAKLGRTSITFSFLMLPMHDATPFSKGTRVMVKIDPGTMRPSPFSPGFREMMAPWSAGEAG